MLSLLLRTARRLFELGRPHRRLLWAAVAFMGILGLTTGTYAWLMGPALRYLLTGGEAGLGHLGLAFPSLTALPRETALWIFPGVVIVVGAVKGVGYLGQFYFVGLFAQRIVVTLRRTLFEKLLTLSPGQISERRTGDLLSRLLADVAAVEQAATYTVASWLRDSLSIVILVGVAVSLSWQLSIVALLVVPAAIIPAQRLTRLMLERTREGQSGLGELVGQVREGIGAVRTLQAFNAEAVECQRLHRRAEQIERSLRRAAWARGSIPGIMEVLAALAIAGILVWTASSSSVEPDALVSFLGALILLYQPAKDLGRVSQFAINAAVALHRVDELLGLPITVSRPVDAPAFESLQQEVSLESVSFSWGRSPALADACIKIPVGKVTALVGRSGSGKSTATAILLGLERPSAGLVRFDGRDAETLSLASQRSQFALVSQDPMLFSGTVRENLLVARPTASFDEIQDACRRARATEFVEALPLGYDTRLGERGVTLSGGQRQRLCLARALLSDATVLVLDEATSNLDSENEREVQVALDAAAHNRTVLIVAHRLSSVRRADHIYVLDAGRVVEEGTHEGLLARAGTYAGLWAAQTAS
jgi:subfamily B ATP-binding cassette protein MsbA